ncbi:Spy/CpxP family protein refolding chaperone [Spirosoma arcticum]
MSIITMFIRLSVFIAILLISPRVWAQHAGHPSPYQADTNRTIKALSAQDVSGYLNGRGMGLAKAAELNGYPGPMHVLEAEKELALTASQKEQMKAAYDAMHNRAVGLGKQIVEQETSLDKLFALGKATPEAVQTAVDSLAILQGRLRLTHLDAHLKAKQILTTQQVNQYSQLRGYTN